MVGYIFLHRKMAEWEWYDDANTMRLFIHCLLRANHKPNNWRGVKVDKGMFITSISKLGEELKLSKQQIRSAIINLETTNEITRKTTNKYTMINIVNWRLYQDTKSQDNTQDNNQITNEQQTNNKQITTNNNDKNDNTLKNENKKTKELPPFEIALLDFKEMRIKMKSPLTKRAESMIRNKLIELSPDAETQIAILNQSIMNGWKSVYALKVEMQKGKNGKPLPPDVEVEWLDGYIKKFKEDNK